MAICHHGIEVVDVTQAVTSTFERIGEYADTVFSNIKSGFAIMTDARIAIGHHHFCQRGAVEDRTQAALILIVDGVQNQPLSRVKANAELPFLPVDLVSIDGKTRAFRLGDL